MLPRSLAALDGGGTLAFGVFSASRDGLRLRNKLLPWSDVARTDLYRGRLLVFRTGRRRRWAAVPTGKVPNLALLQALVSAIDDRRRTVLSA